MVGGVVIGIIRYPIHRDAPLLPGELDPGMQDEVLLHVQGVGSERNETRTALVNERTELGRAVIGIGDSVWWQSEKLLWTPKDCQPHHPRDYPLQLVWHS